MKVIDLIQTATQPFMSVEIIPPRRGSNIHKLYGAIESILPYSPKYIDVTSHGADVIWEEMPDGTFKKRVKRKSPGTFGLCAVIKYKFGVEPVPHILCSGFTREETEDALIELNYLGVENLLLIRGDSTVQKPIPEGRTTNKYAIDLVKQVDAMNRGKYLDELLDAHPTQFCIGVSAYPEKHFEAPNLAYDIEKLRLKQEVGAHYAVSQMFFDNEKFYRFKEQCKVAGITIPIVPGLKILTKRDQLINIPRAFHTDLPEELVERMTAAPDDKAALEVGIEWAYRQSLDLLEHGELNLHYYIMQNTAPFRTLMDRLKL